LWFILRQINFWNDNKQGTLLRWIDASPHPVRYGGMAIVIVSVLVLVSIVLPALLVDRSEKFVKAGRKVFESLFTLSAFYIVLDALGLLLILYRNLS